MSVVDIILINCFPSRPAGQLKQAGCGEWSRSRILCMLVRKLLCNVNDTKALIRLCLLVTSHLDQIRDPCHSQVFTIAHMVIGLSLHIHSFIHLSRSVVHVGARVRVGQALVVGGHHLNTCAHCVPFLQVTDEKAPTILGMCL